MEIFNKNKLILSSLKIEYDEANDKTICHFQNNWLNDDTANINPSHNGYYIKTEKKKNITVIDIDNVALKHNKKLISMIELLCSTLIETTSKGIHYYFSYNTYITSSTNYDLKFDILNCFLSKQGKKWKAIKCQ